MATTEPLSNPQVVPTTVSIVAQTPDDIGISIGKLKFNGKVLSTTYKP